MNLLKTIAFLLLIIGGLNWGLVGLGGFTGNSDWNAVNMLLGEWPQVEWLVYVLVGLSAVWVLVSTKGRMNS